MNNLDYVLLLLLLVFAIRGFIRGMINEVFGVGTLIISLLLAFCFFDQVGAFFVSSSDAKAMNDILAKVLAFFAVFCVSFIVIKFIQIAIKKIFSGVVLKSLDKALGLILGFVEGAVVVFLILFVMQQINSTIDSQAIRDGSFVSNLLFGVT